MKSHQNSTLKCGKGKLNDLNSYSASANPKKSTQKKLRWFKWNVSLTISGVSTWALVCQFPMIQGKFQGLPIVGQLPNPTPIPESLDSYGNGWNGIGPYGKRVPRDLYGLPQNHQPPRLEKSRPQPNGSRNITITIRVVLASWRTGHTFFFVFLVGFQHLCTWEPGSTSWWVFFYFNLIASLPNLL